MTRFFSLTPVSLTRNPEKGLVDVSVSYFVPRKRFERHKLALKICFVQGKRFSRYQMNIHKESQKINHVAGKARRGWSLWRHGRP